MIDLNKSIPTIEMPSIKDYDINYSSDLIVSLSNAGFKCKPMYYEQGYPNALNDCYVRISLVDRLKKAESLLPNGYKFLIYDGWRPVEVQQALWDEYFEKVKLEHPDKSIEELELLTSFYISKPSYNMKRPSLHNTGGAIDLTIIDENGNELDMGTKFDEFSNKSWTNHFEPNYEFGTNNETIMENRRLLYNAMISAGFTNLPSEWWHYDYGTKFWAYFTGNKALYKGIRKINTSLWG